MKKQEELIEESKKIYQEIKTDLIDEINDIRVNCVNSPYGDYLTFEQMQYFMKGIEYFRGYVFDMIDDVFNCYKSDFPCLLSEMDTLSNSENYKHGRWELLDNCSNAGVYCSVCNKKVYKEYYANVKQKSKFCPNCGAIMDGEFKKL